MLTFRMTTYGPNPVVGDIVMKDKVATTLTASTLVHYNMSDIVLPLPGTQSMYPNNALDAEYKRFMTELGLDKDDLSHNQRFFGSIIITSRDLCLSGSYRNILGRVHDMKYGFTDYNKETDILIASDKDVIDKTARMGLHDGNLTAMKLVLSIDSNHSSSMALRELLKNNTY